MTEFLERPALTKHEERVVATHECGHAICALYSPHAPPIDRISIQASIGGALGFVKYGDRAHQYVTTRAELHDTLVTLFGGREAEDLLLDDLSLGSGHDLGRATEIARDLVEHYGMGPLDNGVRVFHDDKDHVPLSETARSANEAAIKDVLAKARDRARAIITEHRKELEVAARPAPREEGPRSRRLRTLVPITGPVKKEAASG